MASTQLQYSEGQLQGTYTTLNSCSMSLKFYLYKHTLTIKEIKSVLPVQSLPVYSSRVSTLEKQTEPS